MAIIEVPQQRSGREITKRLLHVMLVVSLSTGRSASRATKRRGTGERLLQSVRVDRLQHVVACVHRERAQCVSIVRSDEDHSADSMLWKTPDRRLHHGSTVRNSDRGARIREKASSTG